MNKDQIKKHLSEFFGKKNKKNEYNKWRDKYAHIDPKLLKLDCRKLPSDLLKFSQEWPTYFDKSKRINLLIKRVSLK